MWNEQKQKLIQKPVQYQNKQEFDILRLESEKKNSERTGRKFKELIEHDQDMNDLKKSFTTAQLKYSVTCNNSTKTKLWIQMMRSMFKRR